MKLETTSGKIFSLKDLKGSKTVLYFYPKDSTSGCTQEGLDFSALQAKFKKLGVRILGVSRDSLASHEKFKKAQGFLFDLVSDPEELLCKEYDVIKMKSMYGRKFQGVERSTFLIDEKGKIVQEWRKVKVKDHAKEVLRAAEARFSK